MVVLTIIFISYFPHDRVTGKATEPAHVTNPSKLNKALVSPTCSPTIGNDQIINIIYILLHEPLTGVLFMTNIICKNKSTFGHVPVLDLDMVMYLFLTLIWSRTCF